MVKTFFHRLQKRSTCKAGAAFLKLDSNLDIFRSCERFRKCTQPAFWLAALLRRTNVLAEGQNLGAGQLYFA